MHVKVAELWRYPVKSMAGEPLAQATLSPTGIDGDRLVHVENAGGRVVTARTHPRLLGLSAVLGADGEPWVGGRRWDSAEVASVVRRAVGDGARLVENEPGDVFDVLPLSILTDGAIDVLGVDRRRLRPNILVAGAEGLAERAWPGRRLAIGATVIGVRKLRGRCVMTTYDPDTQKQDLGVLERIVTDFGGRMALDCWVVTPGPIAIGDGVTLL
jgi:uncharacterized protein